MHAAVLTVCPQSNLACHASDGTHITRVRISLDPLIVGDGNWDLCSGSNEKQVSRSMDH